MKMTKASDPEIKRTIRLVQFLETTCDVRPFEQERWPLTDVPFDPDDPDDLRKFYAEVKRLSPGLMRVVFGFSVLVDNCCDPDSDTLDWKPEIKKLLERKTEVEA